MRNFRLKRYILIAVLTALIFALGVLLGMLIEGRRVDYLQEIYQKQKVEFASSQLQYNFLSTLDDKSSCPARYRAFDENLKNLDRARERLVNYARDSQISSTSFDLLKREYSIEQINYWMLAQQAEEICNETIVRVLYFYSTNKECPDCAEQAVVLDYYKKIFKEKLLIFALDSNLIDEPIINILMTRYGVSNYPTIVIEDNVTQNYLSQKDFIEIVCNYIPDAKACI